MIHGAQYQYQYQSRIYLARAIFVIKTQSEARLESEVLIVHMMAEVVCLQVRLDTRKCVALSGLTENDGHENDGPSKLQDMKLRDQMTGHEIAGHENARHEIGGQTVEK